MFLLTCASTSFLGLSNSLIKSRLNPMTSFKISLFISPSPLNLALSLCSVRFSNSVRSYCFRIPEGSFSLAILSGTTVAPLLLMKTSSIFLTSFFSFESVFRYSSCISPGIESELFCPFSKIPS